MPNLPESIGRPLRDPHNICAGVDMSGGAGNYNVLCVTQYAPREGRPFFEVREIKGINCKASGVTLDDVVRIFANITKKHGLSTVYGDRYAGAWPPMRFADYGIKYLNPEISGRVLDPGSASNTRTGATTHVESVYYDLTMCVQELGPWIRSRQIALPDNPQLLKELKGMEAKAKSGAKLSISAPPGADQHDDHVAALAISVVMCAFKAGIIKLPGAPTYPKPWAGPGRGGHRYAQN